MHSIFISILAGIGTMGIVYAVGLIFNQWYSAYESQYVERTERDLYGMFSSMPPQRVLQASIICFSVIFFLALFFIGRFDSLPWTAISILIAFILGLFASLLPRLGIKRATALRLRKFDLQLLDALLSMSNALKAGFSILQTFESVVQERRDPISQEFDLFLREVRLGVKFEAAAENLQKRIPSEDLQIVLAGIETARQTGGNLTEVFDRLATVIRERMRVQGRIQSLTAQGRLQSWVIGMMPFLLGVAFYFLQPRMMEEFIRAPLGILMIFIMLLFVAIGFYFIRKIVKIDV